MVLDAQNPIPLYFQLKNIIENQINSAELKPGDKITSENRLCEQYQVSRTTARQAITELVNSGKVVRTQGRGSFVARYPENKPPYRLTGFSDDMKKQGFHPSSKILVFKVILPTPEISRMLRINQSEAVIFLNRLRFIDGFSVGIDYTYLPFNRFPGLMEENFIENSLYETFINKYNIIPSRVVMTCEAMLCEENMCKLLSMSPNIPLLHVTDITFDQNEHLIEYTENFYRGDRYTLQAEILKVQNNNLHFVSKQFEKTLRGDK